MTNPQDISVAVYTDLMTLVDNVYDESVPKSMANLDEFLVYFVNNARPMYGFKTGDTTSFLLIVECYVKNKANGIKNTARLRDLTSSVQNKLLSNSEMSVVLSSSRIEPSSVKDYHAQALIFNIIK